MIFSLFLTALWVIFIIYWILSARGVKKNLNIDNSWRKSVLLRILISIGVIVLISFLHGWQWLKLNYEQKPNLIIQFIGAIICLSGISLAFWARNHLGVNWSGTPSIKEDHDLVTSGPYKFIRHPIYTGILLMLLGSALVDGIFWLIVFIAAGVTFIWRIKIEEGLMTGLFPQQYSEYQKRTKALMPFIW